MAERDEMATSFGAVSDLYERGRPDYPLDAVRWLLEPARHPGHLERVADVGAGTGKLTRAIVAAGAAKVFAVDPDPQMLARLEDALPHVPAMVGTAEDLPLLDADMDAVLFGQAWHWVDVPRASAEAARVLKPGGGLGLVWNLRDESVPWVAEMTRIMHGSHAEAALADGPPRVAAPFGPLEERIDRWSRRMTRADLEAMAWSRSYLITATPRERGRIGEALGALLDGIGAVGDAEVELPYVTRSYRGIRP